MSAADMKSLRLKAGLIQAEMAQLMGLGKTAYVDLEADDPDGTKFKARHMLVLERVSLRLAIKRGDISMALPAIRRDAMDLVKMMRGEDPSQGVA